MDVGKFGAKLFTVSSSKVLTFSDFEISSSLNMSAGEAKGKKPTTTVKGPGLLKVPLTLDLSSRLGVDVQVEIDGWFAILNAGKPYPLILCGKAVSVNQFLLDSCKASDMEIVKVGRKPLLAKAKLSLNFTEYLPPGVQASTAVAGITTMALSSTLTANNAYSVPSGKDTAQQQAERAKERQQAYAAYARQKASSPYNVPSAEEKSTLKRNNPGMG